MTQNNEIVAFKEILGQMYLIDINTIQTKAAEYILFSHAHGIFFKIEYMLATKLKIEII